MADESEVEEERIEVELPADFAVPSGADAGSPEATTPPAGADTATPAAEMLPVEPAPEPAPRRMVPKAALDAERSRRKEAVARFEAAEQARLGYEQELARVRHAAAQRPVPAHPDYDQEPDLKTAFRKYDERQRQQWAGERATLQHEIVATRTLLSEELMREKHPDYDEVLEKSGVAAGVTLNPQTGLPQDAFLSRHIYSSPNPARTAYEYALGRLAKQQVAAAEVRGEARGRREVVEKVHASADRARGISHLPGSTTTRTGLSRGQIAAMSDEQKARIKKDLPNVWHWYLEAG